MINPWLQIPASDYEAHMSLPKVAQAQAIEEIFALALQEYTPESLAVFGCTTGNGFNHINISKTQRVVGIDINPLYLSILKERFASKIPGLEVIEADFSEHYFRIAPVSMVFAALIFEYVSIRDALKSIDRCMKPGATLVVVLQLPSAESSPVSATCYKSLELLSPLMRLVDPADLMAVCVEIGLLEIKTATIPLKMGKSFYVGYYRKRTASNA